MSELPDVPSVTHCRVCCGPCIRPDCWPMLPWRAQRRSTRSCSRALRSNGPTKCGRATSRICRWPIWCHSVIRCCSFSEQASGLRRQQPSGVEGRSPEHVWRAALVGQAVGARKDSAAHSGWSGAQVHCWLGWA